MTDEEKRDYLVLEIAQQLCENAGYCQDCPKSHSPEEFGECELPEICNTLADYTLRKEDEARRELIDKLISVGEACNGMVSVPMLKAWRLEFEDIDLDGWKNLEGLGGEGDK